MADPINYAINVQQPLEAALSGYQVGAALRNSQIQQDQQQAALAAQQQMQADLQGLAANPTPQGIVRAMLRYPQLAEHLNKANAALTEQQRQGESKALMPIYFAAQGGNYDVAREALLKRADALQNSGMSQDAQEARDTAEYLRINPKGGTVLLGSYLASALGPDKFTEAFGKLGSEARANELQPDAVRAGTAAADKAEADARTAGVQAQFAHDNAVADLEKKGWDVKNIQSEIGYRREANRIAAMNAAANRETNALRKEELQLEIDKRSQALAQSTREKAADVESAANTIDNLVNTVDRIKKNPSLNSVVGTMQGRMGAYVSDEAADAIALIDTLGSQSFLSQIPAMKGLGALSNAEGEKLQSSLQNLSRVQSEGQFRKNLDEVQRLMFKARANVEKRYGLKVATPDTPDVDTSPATVAALLNKYLNPSPPGAR